MSVRKQPFPSADSPAGEGTSYPLGNAWYYLLRTLWSWAGGSGATLPAIAVTVSASPFLYDSDISGNLVIQGGTVSEISIVRGSSNVITGLTQGVIPMLRGDSVSITYSGLPTVTFLPTEFIQSAT